MIAIFDVNRNSSSPIWHQIEESMRSMISLGALAPGDAVPSVRHLARRLGVNPNTVARAYRRLIDAGVLAVRRGQGTYVAESPAQLKNSERNATLHDGAVRYAGTALAIGASLSEAATELELSFERLTRDYRRKAKHGHSGGEFDGSP